MKMELWVRSQDREKLLKINGLQYQNCKLVENETVEANILIGFYSSYENEILGEYKTKERALEVLDEIQDLLQNAYVGSSNRIIYQMPEKIGGNNMQRKQELEKVKEIIRKNFCFGDCGIYNTRNIVGDFMSNIFIGKYFKVDLCFYYSYFEIFGTNENEFNELKKYYGKLEEEVDE